jgi:hypothetical protein
VFISHRPDTCRQRLESLPAEVRARVRVIQPLDDRRHFGLLEESRLVIGKCAFMQVSECLSLKTPIIGFYFQGDFHLNFIPRLCRRFAHMTSDTSGDSQTVARARRFLDLTPSDMHAVHSGLLGAADRTASFLEELPQSPRWGTTSECAELGASSELMLKALAPAYSGSVVQIVAVRMSSLRQFDRQRVFTVLCRYTVDGQTQARRLWFRRFKRRHDLEAELARASQPDARRTVLYHSVRERTLLEQDIGEDALPPLK